MKRAVRLAFGFWLVIGGIGCIPSGPKAQVTVLVIDDTGNPVEGALVAVLGVVREQEGKTDNQGRFVATIRNRSSKVEMAIRKKGYYAISRHIHEFSGGHVGDRWQPWNPELSFLLPKKRNPVVLQEREVRGVKIPHRGKPVGYDLLVGDWVAPAGKGLVGDFIILAHTTITNGNATTNRMDLTFSNPADGLIRTNIHWRNDYTLRLPPIAPETGYSNKWGLYLNELRDPQTGIVHAQGNWSQDDNYFFRVRSKLDASGRIQSAIYGKIYRGIHYDQGDTDELPGVLFHYYLNPDGTRNLESKGERPDNDDP
jgi:hypothetical protein